MQNLKNLLKNKFKDAERVAVLGVGSDLRGDDVAGMLVAEEIEQYRKKIKETKRLKIFFGATAPENLTGEIKRFNPTHLLIVDSAESGKRPGAIILLTPENVGGVSFSTHTLPLKVMTDYLLTDLKKCQITIIGIQPKRLNFNCDISKEVKNAALQVIGAVKEIIKTLK